MEASNRKPLNDLAEGWFVFFFSSHKVSHLFRHFPGVIFGGFAKRDKCTNTYYKIS